VPPCRGLSVSDPAGKDGNILHMSQASEMNERRREAFLQYPGQWVALNRVTGECVVARLDPLELSAYLRENDIRGISVVRAPEVDEPEMVGFG